MILAVVLIAAVPLFALRGAEFGGSDDAGSVMVEEITGDEYEPWFTPVLETVIGGELPGEVESPFFLHPDRNRSRYHRILHGTACGTEEMDEKGSRRT